MAGGYYGGQTNNVGGHSSGAGGSGYISGHEGCIAINSADDITPKVDTYSEISDSYHYSGKIFTNTELTTGTSTTSKATITLLNITDTNPPIENITVNKGKMTRNFNQSETDYYIELDEDEVYPTITVITTSDDVTVEGGTEQTIETSTGETIKQIKATTKEGVEYIYNLHFIRKASSSSYLKNIKIGGKEIENFVATKTRYEITIPYYIDDTLEIDAIKEFPSQIVTGLGTIDVSNPSTIHTISVTSEDGNSTTEYTLILNREPTTKLKSIDIQNQDFASIFQSDKYEYEIEVTTGVISLNIQTIPYIKDCKVTIKGAGYIKEGKNLITITSSKEGLESSVYKIYVIKGENLGEVAYDFDYTGDYQVFTAPALGYYKFEAWGASGGLSRLQGGLGGTPGKGGYTSGIIKLNEGDQFYVYVGGQGTNAIAGQNVPGGWNGGGLGTWDNSDNEAAGGGGGATDFRLVSGNWNDSASLYSRIMVAGAGRRSILVLQGRLWRRIKWIFTLFMLSSWNSNFRLCSRHG